MPVSVYGGVGLGAAAAALLLRRARRRRRADPLALLANFGEPIPPQDDAGALVTILDNAEGVELYSRCWGAEKLSSPRAIVLLIHGAMWHSGYFEELANVLVGHGFVVYSYDLQAQGRSGSARGLRGDVADFQHLVDDANAVLEFASGNHLGAPVFVYGESMGAMIALLWAQTHGSGGNVKGLILAGSNLHVDEKLLPPKLMLPVLGSLVRLFPDVRPRIDDWEGTFDDAFGDKAFAEQAREDPLVVFEPPTLRFMLQGLRRLRCLNSSLAQVDLPFLALHGEDDTRCDVQGSKRLYDEACSNDKTFKSFKGMKHQLLQETPENRRLVFDEIVAWLTQRAPKILQTEHKSASSSGKVETPPVQTSTKPVVNHAEILRLLSENGF